MNGRWGIYLVIATVIFLVLIIALILSQRPQQVIILQPTPRTTTIPTSTPSLTPTPTPTPSQTLSPRASDLITVTNPSPNQLVTSPLTITGQARGNWFFEASAPVELLDGNGQRIVQGIITAQGDWMTTNFVPFTGTLTFSAPSTNTGQLVLQNDNPSGLPENSRQLIIPVRFR